ncbi:GAF domain-containing protein [Spirillospora sp. CA-255316]
MNDMTSGEIAPIEWRSKGGVRSLEGRRRLDATFDVMTAVLDESDLSAVLTLVATRARAMVNARLAFIVLPVEEDNLLRVDVAIGVDGDRIRGLTFRRGRSMIGRAFSARQALSTRITVDQGLGGLPAGPILLLPLETGEATHGVLAVLGRPGESSFGIPAARELFRFATMSATLIDLAEEHRAAGPATV